MNVLLLLSTLSTIAMAQDNCCSYPATLNLNTAVPSSYDFLCSEPVMLACVKTGPMFKSTAIVRYTGKEEIKESDLLITGPFYAYGTFTCNTSTQLWNHGAAEIQEVACAYETYNGYWTFGF